MKTILLAKSSSGEAYTVEFVSAEDSVRVFCHCQAGVLQQMCKHKLALLKGDVSMLFDPSQSPLLTEVHAWPQFAKLKGYTEDFEKKLKQIELAKSALAKEEKSAKAEFARGLTHGFK
jgi:hypothetical protein